MGIYGAGGYSGTGTRGSAFKGRLLIVGVLVAVSVITYFGRSAVNPVTGQSQRVALSTSQEIAMGLQAAPEMARQFGGLHPDQRAQGEVDRVGAALVRVIPKAAEVYPFEFHLLADAQTVNAFALPGGQIFITAALYSRLETEGQLAGVLGHEIAHVVHRHSAQQMAKSDLLSGLAGAVATGASDGSAQGAMMARGAMVAAQMMQMKYGRADETQSDEFAVEVLPAAGYDPRAMIGVMRILREASGGRGGQPEWMSSHPDPGNRIEHLEGLIARKFPQGVPGNLKK